MRDGTTRKRLRLWLLAAVGIALTAGLVFLPAGTLAWSDGWIWFGLVMLGWVVTMIVVARTNPALIEQRTRVGPGTKTWDRVLLAFGKLFFAALVVVPALGVRFGWPVLPRAYQGAGVLLFVVGYAIIVWAMAVNAHFEATVRIQTDREHRVIDTGPYGRVRHPGYSGFVLVGLGSALVLRSAWALVPAAAIVLWLAVRAVLEERLLLAELEGYADYARRVRYRFVPGVW